MNNRKEFLKALAATKDTGEWGFEGRKVRGKNRCCPMTAVWTPNDPVSNEWWQHAADDLGIGPRLQYDILNAADNDKPGGLSASRRKLRAEMLKALGLEEPQ